MATYGTASGWKLLINFTSDRGQAIEAVLGLEAPDVGARDPLGLTLAAPVPGEMMAPGVHLETGSQGDQEMVELQRRLVETVGSLDPLANLLGHRPVPQQQVHRVAGRGLQQHEDQCRHAERQRQHQGQPSNQVSSHVVFPAQFTRYRSRRRRGASGVNPRRGNHQ